MLKGIPAIIVPELMKLMMEMGHGGEMVLADGNFPAAACAQRLIRCDGHKIINVLDAVLQFFPCDKSVERPIAVMSILSSEKSPEVWREYEQTLAKHERQFPGFEYVERFAFYERARKAYVIVATSDLAYKGNIILRKGVIRD